MLKTKMNAVISEVCDSLAERDELIHVIALALLTRTGTGKIPSN